jgi:response regulator of citrate/malate metabolism
MRQEDRQIERRLDRLEERMHRMEASQSASQADIDNLTTELGQVAADVTQVSSDLSASSATLQSEIDSLVAANPGVDVTALKAAADALDPQVQTLDGAAKAVAGLVPTPAAPASDDPAPAPPSA